MLDYAAKLTREPWNMVEDDVKALKKEGLTDVGILNVKQVAGYYAYVNRLADGLGVELESFWDNEEPVFNNQGPGKILQVGSIEIFSLFNINFLLATL